MLWLIIVSFAANSAKGLLKPYFADIIEQFKPYLVPHSDTGGMSEEDMRKLQIQTLGIEAIPTLLSDALKYFCLNLFIRELWFEEFIFIDSQRNL
jgi:hypothetical protein